MAKEKSKEEKMDLVEFGSLAPLPVREIQFSSPKVLKPKEVARVGSLAIPKSEMPDEFQDVEARVIEAGFPPVIQWQSVGDRVYGRYLGMQTDVGKYDSNLYNFEYKDFTFSVWGNVSIDRILQSHAVKEGDFCIIVYVGDMDTGKNPCRLFQVEVYSKPERKERRSGKVIDVEANPV